MTRGESWQITTDGAGAGSFLDPPGSAQHRYGVVGKRGGHEWYSGSLEGVLDEHSGAPEHIRRKARRLLDEAELVCSEAWVRQVYGYFRNCYSPDGAERNVSACVIDPTHERSAEHHLAVLLIRRYFPDHEPRLDLIAHSDGYGARKCVKCDQTVQYEARLDAWAVFNQPTAACPKGGNHETEVTG